MGASTIRAFLFRVQPLDPVTLELVAAVILGWRDPVEPAASAPSWAEVDLASRAEYSGRLDWDFAEEAPDSQKLAPFHPRESPDLV